MNVPLEFEPIELIYILLVILALGFALFFFLVSLAVCCSYVRNGFGVTNTEDTLATNESMNSPQILSVISMDPNTCIDDFYSTGDYKSYLSSPNYNRFAPDEPPPKYDQIFSSKDNTFY